MRIDKNTWIISDTHFGHYNMIKLCNRPLDFNEKIIRKWERLVGQDDLVLHLGDLAIFYGPTTKMWIDRATELPGYKYLIKGNHDLEDYNYPGWSVIPDQVIPIGQTRILFSHYPRRKQDHWDINIHGHLHGGDHHRDDYEFDYHHNYDVGVDVMGLRPYRLGELLERI